MFHVKQFIGVKKRGAGNITGGPTPPLQYNIVETLQGTDLRVFALMPSRFLCPYKYPHGYHCRDRRPRLSVRRQAKILTNTQRMLQSTDSKTRKSLTCKSPCCMMKVPTFNFQDTNCISITLSCMNFQKSAFVQHFCCVCEKYIFKKIHLYVRINKFYADFLFRTNVRIHNL